MYQEQNHIIEKVFLEVNTTSQEKAYFIKNNIDLFLKNDLFPRLEKILDEFDIPNQTLRFHTLNIDFEVNNWESPKQ